MPNLLIELPSADSAQSRSDSSPWYSFVFAVLAAARLVDERQKARKEDAAGEEEPPCPKQSP